MNQNDQHLDFRISQYVDGTLDPAERKAVEQQLLSDASAQALHREHREVQDLLEDWGSRIPLINWDEFDRTMSTRLQAEARATQRTRRFRLWLKPVAVAAGLLMAVGIGAGLQSWLNPSAPAVAVAVPSADKPTTSVHVTIEHGVATTNRSLRRVEVAEVPPPAAPAVATSVKLEPTRTEGVAFDPANPGTKMMPAGGTATFGMAPVSPTEVPH